MNAAKRDHPPVAAIIAALDRICDRKRAASRR